jgi:hypothetical protein
MFAGLDSYGHAQWVNITPTEVAETMDDYMEREGFEGTKFCLLTMEGEAAQSRMVAKILAKAMECPVDELSADLLYAIRNMRQLGVTWNKDPLELEVRVIENPKEGKRSGKYSFWLEDVQLLNTTIGDVDGFDDLTELFGWIRTYFLVVAMTAEIPIMKKSLRINEKLQKMMKKRDLAMFDEIKNESSF